MTDYGLFTLDAPARTARGTLMPWGVRSLGVSKSGTPPVTFPRGQLLPPRDPMVVSLNDEHARFGVIGRATALEDRPEGLWAEFTIADTPEGDIWLADHGEKAYFSAEVADLRIVDGLATGRLAAAAVTGAPAFPGTAVFSLLGELDADGQLDIRTDDDETPAPDPVADDEPDPEPDETEEAEDMPQATVPQASFSRRQTAPALTKAGFFSALNRYRRTADMAALRPYMAVMTGEGDEGMFALADITYDNGGLADTAGLPSQWLGELWDGAPQRRVVPLLTPGRLTGIKIDAWKWLVKPSMAAWAGNKTPIPSNPATVAPENFYAQRYAGGNDLAREFYDFGRTDVIDSYVEAMVESYAALSDSKAVAELEAGATAFTPGAAGINPGLAGIVDGALAVIAANAEPTFALVASDVYRDILLTPKSESAEYLNVVATLTGSSTSGFTIRPSAELTAGEVIVGDRRAATAWELPGVPIRVSAPDLIKGGINEAFFGYIAVGVTYPAAVVKGTVTVTAAAAAEPVVTEPVGKR